MTTPRRRLVRPGPLSTPPANPQRVQKVRAKLDRERVLLDRWMVRLKRAFTSLTKHQHRVAHLERRIRQMETP